MSDLMTRLAALHEGTPGVPGDDVVAADLARGLTALGVRRRRRVAVVGVAAVAVVATASVSSATVFGGTAPAQRAVASSPAVTATPGSTAPTTAVQRPVTRVISLVSYRGTQLPGYTVTRVPEGYVLQGISDSVLAVARAGDTSSLDVFEGKLVVIVNDFPDPGDGRAVTVGERPGHLSETDGVQMLHYSDGSHDITVQAWSDVDISPAQLVAFAEGVTVLPNAREGHG